jgi:hypothetical protein
MALTNLIEETRGGYIPENSLSINEIKNALDTLRDYNVVSEAAKEAGVSKNTMYKYARLVNAIKRKDSELLKKYIGRGRYSRQTISKCRKVASFYDGPAIIEKSKRGKYSELFDGNEKEMSDTEIIMKYYYKYDGVLAEMMKHMPYSRHYIMKVVEKENGKVLLRTKVGNCRALIPFRAPDQLNRRNPLTRKYGKVPAWINK